MYKKTVVIFLAFFSIGVVLHICKGATPVCLIDHIDSMQDTINMENSFPNPSRDGEIPDVPIPDVKIPNVYGQGSENKFTPLPYYSSRDLPTSNYVTGPTTFNTDPKLYKLDKEVFGEKTSDTFEEGHLSTETMILAGSIFIIGLLTGIILLLLKRK